MLTALLSGCRCDDITTEHPTKTELILATLFVNPFLSQAVSAFNQSNDLYYIRIIDYSEFDTEDDYRAGYTKLITEITSGNIPDILNLWPLLPAHEYVAKGLLVDLYPYIDSDPELSRSTLIENVMKLSEINGGFYRVFPGFNISSMIGSTSVLGEDMGWTIDEFRTLLEANPQADMPLGRFYRTFFLTRTVTVCIDQFVDLSTGTCSFDSDEFIHLLEVANTLPEEIDYRYEEVDLISFGRQIIMYTQSLNSFKEIQIYKAIFDSEIVFKGFPTEGGIGNIIDLDHALAMTTECSDKQGAWEFLRFFLTEEYQRKYAENSFYLPSNQVVFDEMLEAAMTPVLNTDINGDEYEVSQTYYYDSVAVETFAITQDEADQIIALIDSASFLHNSFNDIILDIIRESLSSYYMGHSSAVETANVIQSKVSILLSEQR